MIDSRISALLSPRSPADIPWLVVAIVINALWGVSGGWCRSYVGKKKAEVIPAIADLDSTPPVVWVPDAVGIVATLSHGFPRYVLAGTMLAMFLVVAELIAAATSGSFGSSNLIAVLDADSSAVTSEFPELPSPLVVASHADSNKLPKPLTGNVLETGIGAAKLTLTHGVSLLLGCVVNRAGGVFAHPPGLLYCIAPDSRK